MAFKSRLKCLFLKPIFCILFATFLHFARNTTENQAPESAQKNINLKILSELQIITPDIIEQNQFADFVHQVDKSREEVKKSLEKTQQLYDSLMQEYFG